MNTSPALPRVIGPWMGGAIVVGTVIGSGVFKKGQNVAANCPEVGLAISVWVLGGLLALLGALTIAEVAVRLPKAGGNYVYLRTAYGRWAGFIWGWVDFGIIRTSSIGVLAVMAVESFCDLLRLTNEIDIGRWPRVGLTVAVIGVLTGVNIRGTKLGGTVQFFLTLLKVISLLAIIALPIVVLGVGSPTGLMPKAEHYSPLWPSSFASIDWLKYGSAVVAVLWAYHGWLNITPVAEEVKNPQRNIPIALVGGVLVLIGLYVGANLAYYSAIPAGEMAGLTNTPVSTEFFLRYVGPVGSMIASLILMTSVLGSLNGNILVAPRLLYAMSEDGLAPARMRALHGRFQTPAAAMLVFSGWATILVVAAEIAKDLELIDAKKKLFDILTDYCVFGAIVFETLGVASVFILRIRDVRPTDAPEVPYRCPGYPVVPGLYVLILAAILASMFLGDQQRPEAISGSAFVAVGLVVYAMFLKRRPTA